MKVINGEEYLTIGEVAKIIKRTPYTIKNWYEWQRKNPDSAGDILPEVYQDVDNKRTRYFAKKDIDKLIKFRDMISYGFFGEFNAIKWGRRGKEIFQRKRKNC